MKVIKLVDGRVTYLKIQVKEENTYITLDNVDLLKDPEKRATMEQVLERVTFKVKETMLSTGAVSLISSNGNLIGEYSNPEQNISVTLTKDVESTKWTIKAPNDLEDMGVQMMATLMDTSKTYENWVGDL